MPRTVLACALLAALAQPGRADQGNSPSETRIRLTVPPASAPRPSLRYLLLPEHRELNPGNPCLDYMKCFMGQQKFFFGKESVQRRETLLALPLRELAAQELREFDGVPLSQADWAARLDAPDWQVLLKLKSDGPAVLLPDIQQLPHLAEALKVRFRGAVAKGQFHDALRTAKTMFALARHLGEHPTLAGNLEGVAIARLAISPLEEMLERPGCPNLYWALTNLPHPLVSLDKGLSGERDIFVGSFRDLDERAPMTEDQIERFIAPLDVYLAGGRPVTPGDVRRWLKSQAEDEAKVRAARHRLVEYGLPERTLPRFPAEQVILLDEKREYEVRRDEILKLMNLPLPQSRVLVARINPSKGRALFADPFLEAISDVNQPLGLFEQRIALLRHVEALRLHAADHNGTLPAELSDMSVPLPDDPFTGKPFRYEVKGNTAHLRGTPPQGEEQNPTYNVHYEVTLQK